MFGPSAKPRPLRFLPALLWAALIFTLSHQTGSSLPSLPLPGLDKVVHAAVYGVLAALLAWGAGWPGRAPRWAWLAVICAYAVSDEWHQTLVPGRTWESWDLAADLAGAALVLAWMRRYSARR